MSNLLSVLNKSMRQNAPKTLRGRANMVGEVVSYGDETIKVKLMNGPIAGQEVDIKPMNSKISDFTKPSKAQTSKYTEPGGILRLDGVEADKDGVYKSSWINAWIKNPGDDHKLVVDRLVSYHDTGRKTKGDQPLIHLHVMNQEAETTVGSIEEFEKTLAEAFAKEGAATLIDIEDGNMEVSHVWLPGSHTDEGYVRRDPVEYAKSIVDGFSDEVREAFTQTLSERGMVIVPTQIAQIGGKTAEETAKIIDKAKEAGKQARIMTVNPFAYETPSVGLRLAGALARTGDGAISKEHADRLKEAFLESAPETAKEAFHKNGWRGVSDTDLKEFFASKGVELKDHGSSGWNRAALHMQRYDGSESDFFVAKTHESARYGAPYPALECTKDLRAAYNTELTDAVMAAVAGPSAQKSAEAEAKEAEKPSKAKDAPAEDKAEMTADAEMADIDQMLDDIGNDSMDI